MKDLAMRMWYSSSFIRQAAPAKGGLFEDHNHATSFEGEGCWVP